MWEENKENKEDAHIQNLWLSYLNPSLILVELLSVFVGTFTALEVPKVYCRKLEGEPAHQLMSQLFGCHSNNSLIISAPKILSLL